MTETAPSFSADAPALTGTVGVPYSSTITATGSPAPAYAVANGALPPGVSLDSASGQIAGTPTEAGTFTVQFSATNGFGDPALSAQHTITISSPEPVPAGLKAKLQGGRVSVGKAATLVITADIDTLATVKVASKTREVYIQDGRAVVRIRFTHPGLRKVIVKAADERVVIRVRVRR